MHQDMRAQVTNSAGGLWVRTKWPRWSFVLGLILGVILGWVFHGVISFVIRFFFVLVLLVPLLVVGIAYWRLRRRSQGPQTLGGPGLSVVTWEDAARTSRRVEPPRDDEIIDPRPRAAPDRQDSTDRRGT